MNIALIIDYSAQRIFGGPQSVAYDTVEGLKKNYQRLEKDDIHIHIISSSGTYFHSRNEIDEKYPNISYEFFKRITPSAFFSDINYYYHMNKRKSDFDLLHSHQISGALAGSLLHIPTIFTPHGIYWKEKLYEPNIYSRMAYGELNVLRFKYIAPHLKKLIAISPYVISEVDHFLKTKVPEMEVIENPVSDVFFAQEKKEQEGLLIYPGIVIPRKNQIGLIKTLHLLKKDKIKFHCILAGPVPDRNYVNLLQRLVRKYDLQHDVSLTGTIPFDQLLTLYSEASILIMTSLQETAPRVISEAMATGTPVIASNIAGIPYMVSSENSGFLINPRSPEEIANHTLMLLEDSSLRKKFKEKSRQIARSRWKSDVIVSKQLDLYSA